MTKQEEGSSREDPMRYASGYHAPVLYKAIVQNLITDPAGVYVDGTVGGGGHAAALLEALGPDGRVVGIDQDAEALDATRRRLAGEVEAGRLVLVRGNFGKLKWLLEDQGLEKVDGLLLDLGVSSHQIDAPERGFSFQAEGALDMRMDPRGALTAEEVVNRWSEHDLREVIRSYGEERRAISVVRAILKARPIETTTELADVVRSAVPTRDEVKTLARVFQGIRIAVNSELERLEQALHAAVDHVHIGGRMAVISYHSLEDRRVKRFFRYGNLRGEPVRDLYGNLLAPWKELTRKPIRAGEAEVEANPRARSARLRIAERAPEEGER